MQAPLHSTALHSKRDAAHQIKVWVLFRCRKAGSHPYIATSHCLTPTKKTLLGLVWAVQYFRWYLLGRKFEFVICTATILWNIWLTFNIHRQLWLAGWNFCLYVSSPYCTGQVDHTLTLATSPHPSSAVSTGRGQDGKRKRRRTEISPK